MPSKNRPERLIAALVVAAPRKKSLLCSGNGMWLWESWAALHSRQRVSTDVCKTNAFRCSSRMFTTGDSSKGRGQVEVLAQWPTPLRLVCPLIGWCQECKQAREMAPVAKRLPYDHGGLSSILSIPSKKGRGWKPGLPQSQCCRRQDWRTPGLLPGQPLPWQSGSMRDPGSNIQVGSSWGRYQKSLLSCTCRCPHPYRE